EDHHGLPDVGEGGEGLLDLGEVDLEAADRDLRVPAAEYGDPAGAGVEGGGVTGVQPAVRPAGRVVEPGVGGGGGAQPQFAVDEPQFHAVHGLLGRVQGAVQVG